MWANGETNRFYGIQPTVLLEPRGSDVLDELGADMPRESTKGTADA